MAADIQQKIKICLKSERLSLMIVNCGEGQKSAHPRDSDGTWVSGSLVSRVLQVSRMRFTSRLLIVDLTVKTGESRN